MGRGVFITGLVLGILGILWSLLMFAFFLVITAITFGAGGALLPIPGISFLTAIATIVGGVLGRKREVFGAAFLLGTGVVTIAATLGIGWVVLSESTPFTSILMLSLVAVWWAYGLVIAGIIFLLRARRAQQLPSQAPAD